MIRRGWVYNGGEKVTGVGKGETMTVAAPAMTAEELLYLPEDGYRYELVKGELRKIPPRRTRSWLCGDERRFQP